ncbi:hypothetical protein GCM10010129_42360 [Streptomyces fumigatiscleroticus]|nr:hypothetical protein GCM10010129_42360 [Streptomyces fumigatiscleroticus]
MDVNHLHGRAGRPEERPAAAPVSGGGPDPASRPRSGRRTVAWLTTTDHKPART